MIIDLSNLTDGFCSKLRVISYFMAVVKLNNLKKKLYIYEKKTNECPFLFTNLCLIKNFKIIKLSQKPKTNIRFNPYNHKEELSKLHNEYLGKNISFEKLIKTSELLYKNFIPNNKIKKKINMIQLPKNFISIHIRSTDREINIKNFINKIQFEEMVFDFHLKKMIKNLSNYLPSIFIIKNIFVSSDNKNYKNLANKELKDKYRVFHNKSKYKTKNFRQTSGYDFVTELFCLSKSSLIVSTLGGAVPLSASLISKKKIKVLKLTNQLNIYFILKLLIFLIFKLKILRKKFMSNLI